MGHYRRRLAYFAELATAYQAQQRYQDALKAWRAVEILKPDYPQFHLHVGEAQVGLGRLDRATVSFQQALKQAPASAPAHFALAELLRQRGELPEAFTHLRHVTQLDPGHGLAWLRLGQLYQQARQSREAIAAYRRAMTLLPVNSVEYPQAHQGLEALQPSLPAALATGWAELLRQMTGPIVICVLAALLDAGLRPWWIPGTGWLALLLAMLGAFLWVSATSLPRNPLICQLLDKQGLSSALRIPLALFGAGCWLLALGLILLPLGQSFPERPQ
jgi:tetratricopeptide (TPR) repeat protein